MGEQRRTEVRSYRSVFALERRIYRIDRLRLNPSGVPLRGVGYAAALLVAAQLVQRLPVVATVAGLVPWPLRDLICPLALAAALTALRLDGRHAHYALVAALRYMTSHRHLSGFLPCAAIGTVWRPGALVMLADGSQLRALRYRGAGRVLVRVAHAVGRSRGFRASELELRSTGAAADGARGIRVAAGGALRVRGERACARR